jgi:hypothetical protein
VKQPEYLWHYTRLPATVAAILGNESLRLSDVEMMNDERELEHGYSVARYLIDESEGGLEEHGVSGGTAYRYLRGSASRAGFGRLHLVSSLSAAEDSLAQYARYGQYSIRFNAALLEEVGRRNGARLGQCIYDRDNQLATMDQVLRPILSSFEAQAKQGTRLEGRMHLNRAKDIMLRSALLAAAAQLKDPGFHEEQEWRLILASSRSEGLPTRTTNFGDALHFDITWSGGASPITEILVGPPNAKDAARVLGDALAVTGHHGRAPIRLSRIPLRA